jgi:hypothetical protein
MRVTPMNQTGPASLSESEPRKTAFVRNAILILEVIYTIEHKVRPPR